MSHRIGWLALLLAAAPAACSGGAPSQSQPGAVAPEAAAAAPETASPAPEAATPAPETAPAPSRPASAKSRKEPATVDDCKALAAEGDGDDAAAPSEGTGKSDRLPGMLELMKRSRPGFRCCFDLWAGKIPDVELYAKVKFLLKLDPTGKLKEASASPEEGGPMVPEGVQKCLVDVAGTLTYPRSPSGMDTTYTHHFDFKPRSRR